MMQLLTTFASLSIIGTVLLTLIPSGSIRRTAAMAVGLLTLLCWAEGVCALLGIELSPAAPAGILVPTDTSVEDASSHALSALSAQWEATP